MRKRPKFFNEAVDGCGLDIQVNARLARLAPTANGLVEQLNFQADLARAVHAYATNPDPTIRNAFGTGSQYYIALIIRATGKAGKTVREI